MWNVVGGNEKFDARKGSRTWCNHKTFPFIAFRQKRRKFLRARKSFSFITGEPFFHPRQARAKIVTELYSPRRLVANNRCASIHRTKFFSHKLSHAISSYIHWHLPPFEVRCNKSLRIITDSIMTAHGVTINHKIDTTDTEVGNSCQNYFWTTGCYASISIFDDNLGKYWILGMKKATKSDLSIGFKFYKIDTNSIL